MEKTIGLDFMGTLNHPNAKKMIWESIRESVELGNFDALIEAGFKKADLDRLRAHIESTECSGMELRDVAMEIEGAKPVIGRYTSIGAEAGELDCCAVYYDSVNFLAVMKEFGFITEILSTIGTPDGYRSLAEIMLSQHKLNDAQKAMTGCQTADQLISGGYTYCPDKKGNPGKAILDVARERDLVAYIDDELGVVNGIVQAFGEQDELTLPVLCRVERKGVKESGYSIPTDHSGINDILVCQNLEELSLQKAISKYG